MVDDDYKFLQIRDAITSINQKVNLIGVIFEIGFPKQTKGTGLSLSLSLSFICISFLCYSICLNENGNLLLGNDETKAGLTAATSFLVGLVVD